MERRVFIQGGAAVLGAGMGAGLLPQDALAQNAPGWTKAAFESKTMAEAIKALGAAPATESKDVLLQAPEIAENGNVVRLSAVSNLPGTTQIGFVVEKNPFPLSALFDVPAGTDPSFAVNVKMGQTSNVYALARVGDKLFYSVKEVKVTLGGCGG